MAGNAIKTKTNIKKGYTNYLEYYICLHVDMNSLMVIVPLLV